MLRDARHLGFLGPGDVDVHVDHALAFLSLWPGSAHRALDLGSGAGTPGLVLALARPSSTWELVEANHRRATFLRAALRTLQLTDRVFVHAQRAEEVARGPLRASLEVVVARSFGPPAVTAECAAPFLAPDACLIVAEPPADGPGSSGRWPAAELHRLGLVADARETTPVALRRFRQKARCPDQYPRRVGIPRKRPLF